MKATNITENVISRFLTKMTEEEKSDATKEKYLRDIRVFAEYCGENKLTKETVISYKQKLLDDGYAVRSVNSVLASLNSLFSFLGRNDLRVKSLKIQQQIYCPEEKELTKAEYKRLCQSAERQKNDRLNDQIQTVVFLFFGSTAQPLILCLRQFLFFRAVNLLLNL